MKSIIPSILLLFALDAGVECSNIFIFMGVVTSHSPTASIQPLANELVQRGHQVTIFTPITVAKTHPKVRRLCPSNLQKYYENFAVEGGNMATRSKLETGYDSKSFSKTLFDVFDLSHGMCELIVTSPEFQVLIEKEKFDLFIIDSAMNECGFPLAKLFNAKTIIYSALGSIFPWEIPTFGFAPELSWVPGYASTIDNQERTLLDQIGNLAGILLTSWVYKTHHLIQIERIYRESQYGERLKMMNNVESLVQNASLMLVNQHYSDQFPRYFPPFVVPVGGMHIERDFVDASLPKELESFLGQSEFMYISFGTFIRVSAMPKDLLQSIFDVLGASKLKFLWKWEGELPENSPANILFHNWFPQQQLLTHKNIRAFITQGGQISQGQGACHGVPMIMFPVDADQPLNSIRMRDTGNAIVLKLKDITKPELESVLRNIVEDPSYTLNAKRLATACKDRPMSPVDTAVWWTEWVLRTNDPSLLKPGTVGQPLWKAWSLDLWATLFLVLSSITLLFLYILKTILWFSVPRLIRFAVGVEHKLKIS